MFCTAVSGFDEPPMKIVVSSKYMMPALKFLLGLRIHAPNESGKFRIGDNLGFVVGCTTFFDRRRVSAKLTQFNPFCSSS
jgi:hypothetical protein